MPDRLSNARTAAGQVELELSRLDSLSTLPCVGAQLFTRLLQGRFSPSSLADIIESDPALAARILSLIGQGGLTLPERGFSLRRSLDELPAHDICDAVLSVKVMQPFDPDNGTDRQSVAFRKGLLLHSLAVACCAEQLSELTLPNIDSQLAYYAGLLHDIGKFALQETMPKGFARLVEEAESAEECSCTIERKHLGTDHAVVGHHLAGKWQLPNAVSLAVWLHHSDVVTISRDMPEARIAAVVQLADSLARRLSIGQSGSFEPPELSEPVIACLEMDIEQVQHIGRNLSAIVEQRSKVLGLDLPDAVADYCQAAHAAAAQLARQHTELSDENCRLQSASSHFDFAADFLLSIHPAVRAVDIAENFAARWQKFYQTGMVCLYLAPPAGSQTLEAAIIEKLSQSKVVSLDVPAEAPAIPEAIASNFAILNAYDHIGWLFEQLDVDFDENRTKLAPLLFNGRAVGAIAFELHYPGDVELFKEMYRTSASIAGAVLGMALGQEKQQQFAERFVRLISPAAVSLPSKPVEAPAVDSLNALAEMAAGAAHELNNPLAVISGRAQLLAEAQSDPETKEILKQIYENAREASAIIEDMMGFAEPPKPRPAQTDVKQILDEAVHLTGRKTNTEALDIQIQAAENIENVFVDSAQIVSAIANVISNAVESYSGQPGPIEITADTDESAELVKLAIKDQGCGMDDETLKKATQPFFSAKPAGRKRGMGLAYAARFIQLNHGSMKIESQPGSGTTVTIFLPCKQ